MVFKPQVAAMVLLGTAIWVLEVSCLSIYSILTQAHTGSPANAQLSSPGGDLDM